MSPWRNRLAGSAVNRMVGGSFCLVFVKVERMVYIHRLIAVVRISVMK